MDHVLLRYRSDPTDRNFSEVYRRYSPWIKACANRTLRRFPSLSFDGNYDDFANEGMWSVARSARRYVFVCAECDRVFLWGGRLAEHAADEHRLRGNCSKVSIETYSKWSADLTIRGCVRRTLVPEVLCEEVFTGEVEFSEVRVLTKLFLERIDGKLSREASELLSRILRTDRPRKCNSLASEELRSKLSLLSS